MTMPEGHAKRLFLGFLCSITFLVVFALLIAYNNEAESSIPVSRGPEVPELVVSIPASDPQETIDFYENLGFTQSEDLTKGLDIVCMRKKGAPYKLEICDSASILPKRSPNMISALSFPVDNLATALSRIKTKGVGIYREKISAKEKVAFLKDPNGIEIKLIQD